MLRLSVFLSFAMLPFFASAQVKDTLHFFVTKPLPDCNWDTISADSTFRTYFTLTNDSTEKIILQRVSTGDGGCYPYKGDGRKLYYVILQPGEKVDFYFIMVPGKKGPLRRNIAVLLQDEQGNSWEKHFTWQGYLRPRPQ